MDSFFSKTSLYDFLSVLIPGSLLVLWLSVSFTQSKINQIITEYCVFDYVLLFVASFVLGSIAKRIGELAFNHLLRNKDKDLKESLKRCDIDDDFKKSWYTDDADKFRRKYFENYYVAVNGRGNTAIPTLEAKVAFMRSMIVVFIVYFLSTDSWQEYVLPTKLQGGLWGVGLFIVANATLCEMHRIQCDIYRLVWEDAYYVLKANEIMKQPTNVTIKFSTKG